MVLIIQFQPTTFFCFGVLSSHIMLITSHLWQVTAFYVFQSSVRPWVQYTICWHINCRMNWRCHCGNIYNYQSKYMRKDVQRRTSSHSLLIVFREEGRRESRETGPTKDCVADKKQGKLLIFFFWRQDLFVGVFICNADIKPKVLFIVVKQSLLLIFSTRPKLYFKEIESKWVEGNWEIKKLKMKSKSCLY